ncbi:MAG: homoserine dehydrogenase [Actinomycetota bacterium]|nr:homoserine dehydrogenase [Actinomycetota bacterium]
MPPSSIRIGLLGCGNVGAALVTLIAAHGDTIERRTGLRLQVDRVAVRNLGKDRPVDLPASAFTHDAADVVADPDIDLVVEAIGGIEPARTLVLDALKAGKPVVTANKELVANTAAELFGAADAAGVDLLFEAAVAGGIPLIRPLRESLAGEHISRVTGIVNGTTNYILTRMTEAGAGYGDALAEAQGLGYAERDPTADVEGYDAGAKAAIIATIAFGAHVVAGDVYHEGIADVTPADVAMAARLGYVIKLLAVAEQGEDERVAVRVHPAMVPVSHPLSTVRESFNAVFVEGDAVGELMFYGRGAGGAPTASAVLGDVIDAAGNLRKGTAATLGLLPRATIRPMDEVRSRYYLHLEVLDRPGVLHTVSGVFAEHDVSIGSMEQELVTGDGPVGGARIIFITHEAPESAIQATLRDLRELDVVDRITSMLRVVGAGT